MISWLLSVALAGEPRTLAGYTFQRPTVVDNPLPTTHLGARQGAAWLRIPEVRHAGYQTPVDINLVGAAESIDYQLGLSHRSAVFLTGSGTVFAGADADSAYFQGARGRMDWGLGARTELYRQPRYVLGGRLFGAGQDGAVAEPSNLVAALLEDREETLDDVLGGSALKYVLTTERSRQLGVGLSLALALSERVGLQASIGWGVGPSAVRAFNGRRYQTERAVSTAVTGGVALGVSAGPKTPLAVQLELRDRADFGRVDEVRGQLHGGIGAFYTGRDPLQLGVSFISRLRLAQVTEQFYGGELVARFFF